VVDWYNTRCFVKKRTLFLRARASIASCSAC